MGLPPQIIDRAMGLVSSLANLIPSNMELLMKTLAFAALSASTATFGQPGPCRRRRCHPDRGPHRPRNLYPHGAEPDDQIRRD
jgi:hypothetical protein